MKHFLTLTFATVFITFTGHAQQHAQQHPHTATPATPATTTAAVMVNPDELSCHTLTGRVTNHANEPLTGATVMLRSRTRSFSAEACITNAEGEYLLTSKQPIPRNTVLEISAGGYNTFAQPLSNCTFIEASLEPLPGTRFKSDGRIKKTKATGKIH